MKKILKISFTNGRNAEYYLMCQNMSVQITAEFCQKYQISHVYQPYADLVVKINEAYLQSRAFADTKGINDADDLSDKYMASFKSMLKAYKNWPDTTKQAAYELIYAIAKPYWGASSKPIAENIAMVMDLIQALKGEEAKAAGTELGLDSIVTGLEAANAECNRLYMSRADERLARSLADKLKALRKQTDEAFNTLGEIISALYVVNTYVVKDTEKSEELESKIDAINAVLLEYTVPISRRGNGTKADVDTGSTPSEGESESSSDDDERPEEL